MNIRRVAVVGLGYVGLPLAVALARHVTVAGYDIAARRIKELSSGFDRSGEVDRAALDQVEIAYTNDPAAISGYDAYLITVPTPVDSACQPDLSAVAMACEYVGRAMAPGAIVVLESTVYPGTTEEFCGPILARASGLALGSDFYLGYSPERINPGDPNHGLGTVTKVVAGQTADVLRALTALYRKIGPVHEAESLRVAEAAKVIENAQRDINIAFVNELSLIFHKLGIDTTAVLRAARSKWNFAPYAPGLVGGHCIGVDPYYLTFAAQRAGYHPEVILAGRKINDNMGKYVGGEIARVMVRNGLRRRALVLGIAFKENVRDVRNSGAVGVVRELQEYGIAVDVHDPLADPQEVADEYDLALVPPGEAAYGAVVLTVGHQEFQAWDVEKIETLLEPGGVVADVRGVWQDHVFSPETQLWRL